MKQFFVVFLLFSLEGTMAQICRGEKVIIISDGTCDNNPWYLVFEDNFDGNILDGSKWNTGLGHLPTQFHVSQEYLNGEKNLELDNGVLKIKVKCESIYAKAVDWQDSSLLLDDGQPNLRWWPFTSASIVSQQKFGYGKYEIRCKIPKGKGFWPAFWLFGQIGLADSEIDIFEFWNQNNLFEKFDQTKLCREHHMTIHYNGKMCEMHYNGPDYSLDYHTFTLIWDNYKIEWYVDGIFKRRSTKFYTLTGQELDCSDIKSFEPYILNRTYPMDSLMNIIADVFVQSKKNAPDGSTPLPASMEIDYVRYYQRKP